MGTTSGKDPQLICWQIENIHREDPLFVLGHDLKRVQYGWPVGMPLVKSLGGGLWEVRSSLPSDREARALFFVDQDGIVVLHGFIKKTQKTPPGDLNLARKRMKEFDDEN